MDRFFGAVRQKAAFASPFTLSIDSDSEKLSPSPEKIRIFSNSGQSE